MTEEGQKIMQELYGELEDQIIESKTTSMRALEGRSKYVDAVQTTKMTDSRPEKYQGTSQQL